MVRSGLLICLALAFFLKVRGDLLEPLTEDPDATRTPCELIESRHFICDTHWITTRDGYILTVQHIINPFLINVSSTLRPVAVTHGLLGSATHWLINSERGFAADWTGNHSDSIDLSVEGRNLPYLLANLGYDVWLPNLRGNKHSRNHTYYNPDKDSKFWDFSYEQMIANDSPAIVDYILAQTNQETLAWVGHSQGNMVMFGLLAEQPSYSAKVKPLIAVGPVTHVSHITSPIRYVAKVPFLQKAATFLGGELNMPEKLLNLFAKDVCERTGIKSVCNSFFYLFGGYDPEQFNSTRLPVYIAQGFCGTSWMNLVHFGQNINSDRFAKFDRGWLGNLARYNSLKPPSYNLSTINSEHIYLMYSGFDPLADPADIDTLRKALTVPVTEFSVTYPKFSHLDWLWGANVYEQAYEQLVRFLRKYDSEATGMDQTNEFGRNKEYSIPSDHLWNGL